MEKNGVATDWKQLVSPPQPTWRPVEHTWHNLSQHGWLSMAKSASGEAPQKQVYNVHSEAAATRYVTYAASLNQDGENIQRSLTTLWSRVGSLDLFISLLISCHCRWLYQTDSGRHIHAHVSQISVLTFWLVLSCKVPTGDKMKYIVTLETKTNKQTNKQTSKQTNKKIHGFELCWYSME